MLRFQSAVFLSVAIGLCSGCAEDKEFQDYSKADLSDNHDHDHDHDHGHEGVHGGHVYELGDTHAYHAELVFDAATRDITVYFYGSTVGTAQAASDFVFELEADGAESELIAAASPLEGETDETSSRFVIAGAAVPAEITSEEQIEGHFHVTIAGSDYVVDMHAHSHDHDHAHGDDHDHGDDDHAKHDEASGQPETDK